MEHPVTQEAVHSPEQGKAPAVPPSPLNSLSARAIGDAFREALDVVVGTENPEDPHVYMQMITKCRQEIIAVLQERIDRVQRAGQPFAVQPRELLVRHLASAIEAWRSDRLYRMYDEYLSANRGVDDAHRVSAGILAQRNAMKRRYINILTKDITLNAFVRLSTTIDNKNSLWRVLAVTPDLMLHVRTVHRAARSESTQYHREESICPSSVRYCCDADGKKVEPTKKPSAKRLNEAIVLLGNPKRGNSEFYPENY